VRCGLRCWCGASRTCSSSSSKHGQSRTSAQTRCWPHKLDVTVNVGAAHGMRRNHSRQLLMQRHVAYRCCWVPCTQQTTGLHLHCVIPAAASELVRHPNSNSDAAEAGSSSHCAPTAPSTAPSQQHQPQPHPPCSSATDQHHPALQACKALSCRQLHQTAAASCAQT
jgi:hypothetical protein